MIRGIFLFLTLLVASLVGCQNNNATNSSIGGTGSAENVVSWRDSISLTYSIPVDSINKLTVSNGSSSAYLSYADTVITIQQEGMADLALEYLAPELLLFPCNGISLYENGEWKVKNYALFDNILFLPVYGININSRIELLIINIDTGEYDYLSTGGAFFLADADKKVVMNTSRLYVDMEIGLYFYQLDGLDMNLIGTASFDTSDHDKWIPVLYEEDRQTAFLQKEFLKAVY